MRCLRGRYFQAFLDLFINFFVGFVRLLFFLTKLGQSRRGEVAATREVKRRTDNGRIRVTLGLKGKWNGFCSSDEGKMIIAN
jgi:hypothetical protein